MKGIMQVIPVGASSLRAVGPSGPEAACEIGRYYVLSF